MLKSTTTFVDSDVIKSTKLFDKFAAKMLCSLDIFQADLTRQQDDEESEFYHRAVDLYKNIKQFDHFISQRSASNICVSFDKFPRNVQELQTINFVDVTPDNYKEIEESGRYIVCMTTRDVKSFTYKRATKKELYAYVKFVLKMILKKMLEFCDKKIIAKLANKV